MYIIEIYSPDSGLFANAYFKIVCNRDHLRSVLQMIEDSPNVKSFTVSEGGGNYKREECSVEGEYTKWVESMM